MADFKANDEIKARAPNPHCFFGAGDSTNLLSLILTAKRVEQKFPDKEKQSSSLVGYGVCCAK